MKTKELEPINPQVTDNRLHVFWFSNDDDVEAGWYSCFSGFLVLDGHYSESENFGPFASEAEAEAEGRLQYQEWHTSGL